MKKGYTHIAVVLDRSGSMGSCVKDVIGGFNQLVEEQKKVDGTATMTLVQFDNQYEVVSEMVDVKTIAPLTNQTYVPRGSTALLDAIGKTIVDTESRILGMDEKDQPEKVIFVIITDGEENASHETNRDQAMQMINSHRTEKQWEFVFIGANQDAIRGGESIGIRASSAMNYASTGEGTRVMYNSLSRSLSSYRTKSFASRDEMKDYAFFTPDADDSEGVDTPAPDAKAKDDTTKQQKGYSKDTDFPGPLVV